MASNTKDPKPAKRKKLALGRGLEALLPDPSLREKPVPKDFSQVSPDLIQPNPFQPRHHFSESELEALSQSILAQGIIQPLVVRRADSGYELISGERRLRAARMAGLDKVPVVIKNIKDDALLEMSLVENLQREDLNPMEEANAYHQLITIFGLTQESCAQRVGKSRSAVANMLRLRNLPEPIKTAIVDGRLTMGHARALLSLETEVRQQALFDKIISDKLSVRQTEALVRRILEGPKKEKKPRSDEVARYFQDLSHKLTQKLGTKVQIQRRGKKGKVEIEFYNDEDLNRLIGIFENLSAP